MKKTLLLFASLASLFILLLVSCAKEMSVENMPGSSNSATYTFDGGTGICTGATVSGSFKAGTPVTAANTVTVSVSVDSIGSYAISTEAVNGISFSGSGVFSGTGVQNITLTASGTPATAGVFNFSPAANACTFSVTVASANGAAGGTAVYSLNGGTSACTGAIINGVFTAGTVVSSANTVVLNILVDTVGTYTISTNAVNGIQFSATGSFTATGAQTVVLTASGIPAAAGSFAFTPGTNGCSFNVNVVAGGGGGSGNFLRCKIDGVLTNFNTKLVGLYVIPPGSGIPYSISIQGTNSDVAGSIEEFWVNASNPTAPTTGVYNNIMFSSSVTNRGCQVALYPTGFPNLYWGSSPLISNTFSVSVTSVNTSGATGTFKGTIYETNGGGPATKNVTEGEFKITY